MVLLDTAPTSLESYVANGGLRGLERALSSAPDAVIEEVARSGLPREKCGTNDRVDRPIKRGRARRWAFFVVLAVLADRCANRRGVLVESVAVTIP